MLENTRAFDLDNKRESDNDLELSKYYATLSDIFINDAFGVLHRDCATNSISKYLPSAIGLVIPELKKINESAEEAFSRFSEMARDDLDFLQKSTISAFKEAEIDKNTYSVKILNTFHKSIKDRVIFKAIKDFSGEAPDSKRVQAVSECIENKTKIQIYKNCFVEAKADILRFFSGEKICKNEETIILNEIDFEYQFGEYIIKTELLENFSQKIKDLVLDNLIDCDTICGNLILRTRQEGDKITLRKRNVTKTLKKLFTEEKVPIELRDIIPVIVDDNGVVWVSGFGVNKKNAKTEKSKKILSVKVSEKNGFAKNE